jgi:chorismate lyase / 3-hydroxybenzoate synthase
VTRPSGFQSPLEPSAALPLQPQPPEWVLDLFAGKADWRLHAGGVSIRTRGALAHLTTSIAEAKSLTSTQLRTRVAAAYEATGHSLAAMNCYPIRFWNFIPGIGDPMDGGLDRYMTFNAGRYQAYADWYGEPTGRSHRFATASAVGIDGPDLVIHCLAANSPGTPVENPRQISSWRYSTRYGPLPPCFSRATITSVGDGPVVLIGGTASVVGEISRHQGDPSAQLEETLENLAAVVARARQPSDSPSRSLRRLIHLRAYIARADMAEAVQDRVAERCAPSRGVEVRVATLCRPDLLVEIEGVAHI